MDLKAPRMLWSLLSSLSTALTKRFMGYSQYRLGFCNHRSCPGIQNGTEITVNSLQSPFDFAYRNVHPVADRISSRRARLAWFMYVSST